MGGLVSGITDAIGLTNTKGEKRAAAAASAANAQALAMSKEQIALAKEELDFQKAQYQDWKNIYGDIQENLGAYYKNLTPDKLVALGLENQQREFQQVDTAIRRELAQKGLEGSGIERAVTTDIAYKNAATRAGIRTSADRMVNEEKLGFLGIGLGQGTQLLGIIGNSAANATNAFSNAVNSRTSIAGSYLNQATNLGVQNSRAIADAIGAGGTYLASRP